MCRDCSALALLHNNPNISPCKTVFISYPCHSVCKPLLTCMRYSAYFCALGLRLHIARRRNRSMHLLSLVFKLIIFSFFSSLTSLAHFLPKSYASCIKLLNKRCNYCWPKWTVFSASNTILVPNANLFAE